MRTEERRERGLLLLAYQIVIYYLRCDISFGSAFFPLSLPLFFPICTCPSSARPLAHSQYSASSASLPLSFPLALMPRHRPPRPTERARDALQNPVPSGIGSVRDVDAGIYVTMCVSFPFWSPGQ